MTSIIFSMNVKKAKTPQTLRNPLTFLFVLQVNKIQFFLAFSRYMAIIHPLKPRLSSTSTKVVIALIWVFAFSLAFPQCYYSVTRFYYPRTVCMVDWPDDYGGTHQLRWSEEQKKKTPLKTHCTRLLDARLVDIHSNQLNVMKCMINGSMWTVLNHLIDFFVSTLFLFVCSYQFAVILLVYLFPLLVMLVTYSLVGRSLWGGHIPGEATDHYHSQITSKRKVIFYRFIFFFGMNWFPLTQSKTWNKTDIWQIVLWFFLKVVKMMVVVVVTFALCWLPYHVYFILGTFNIDIYKQHYIQQVSIWFSAWFALNFFY